MVESSILGENQSLERAIHVSIGADVALMYGGRNGTRKLGSSKKNRSAHELEDFLKKMGPYDTVSRFFRELLDGRHSAGKIIGRKPSDTVSRSNFLAWACSGKVTDIIKKRFANLMQEVVYQTYRGLIRKHPKQYVSNFIDKTIQFTKKEGITITIANLEALFEDLIDAGVNFSVFWKLFEDILSECAGSNNLTPSQQAFTNPIYWKNSVQALWDGKKEAFEAKESDSGITAVEEVEADIRGQIKAAGGRSIHFFVMPSSSQEHTTNDGPNGWAALQKVPVIIQDGDGNPLDRFNVRREVLLGSDETEVSDSVRAFIRARLAKKGIAFSTGDEKRLNTVTRELIAVRVEILKAREDDRVREKRRRERA